MTDFHQLKIKLLERLVDNSIDQAEYDRLLAQIEKLEGESTVPVETQKTDNLNFETQDVDPKQFFPSPSKLSAGTSLGKFEIQSLLGKGGMGEVWKARDTVADRLVVVKTLPAALHNDAAEMAKVKSNFQQIYALQHQHICPLYDLGSDPQCGYYLVMKCVDGITLDEFRKQPQYQKPPLPLPHLKSILSSVADALDYAHSVQVIHRDIKPQNIMLGENGQFVQVVDFGLAAQIRTSVSRVSQVKMECCGTPPYMAPEQWKAEYQDGSTDQYALAVIAYELLAGRLPFEASSLEAYAYCAVREDVPLIEGLSRSVNDVLVKGLAKLRQDRYPSCGIFVANLSEALEAQEKIDQEIGELTKVISQDATNADTYVTRGVQWAIRGNYDEALEDFEAALRLDPQHFMACYNRANISIRNGEFQQTIRDYTQTLRGWSDDIRPYLARGHAWTKLHKPKKALADFDKAVRIAPESPRPYNARAWILATSPDRRARNGRRAVNDAKQACELSEWDNFSYIDTLAAAYAEVGNFEEAIRYQKSALEKGAAEASPSRLDALRTRLEDYQAGRPFRDQIESS